MFQPQRMQSQLGSSILAMRTVLAMRRYTCVPESANLVTALVKREVVGVCRLESIRSQKRSNHRSAFTGFQQFNCPPAIES